MRAKKAIYDNEEPVSEQNARALAINEALRSELSSFLNEQVQRLKQFLGAGILFVVAGLGLLFVSPLLGIFGLLVGVGVGVGGYVYVQNQQPSVQITGMEKRYWTGYLMSGEDGTLMYDATSTIPDKEFELDQVKDADAVSGARVALEDSDDLPVVMQDDMPVEEQFINYLDTVDQELAASESRTVEAPVFTQDSPVMDGLDTIMWHAGADPIDAETEITPEEAAQDLTALSELGNLAEENPLEDDLREIEDLGRSVADEFTDHQDEAVERLNDHLQVAADAFGIVSYNFYCPDCANDDVESRLTLSDDAEDEVYCETCRSYHNRDDAIPRHKLKDELVTPIWDQLWDEKADEKRKIYENIEDQKLDLKEREYEQCQEEIRTTTERIRDLRSKIRDLRTQAQAAQGAVDEVGDLMVKYDRLNEQRKTEFSEEVSAAFEEIDQETEQILEETRNEEQERLQEAEEEAEEKAEMLRAEERQRQAEMIAAQKQIQENIAEAQMQHEENIAAAEIQAEQEMTKQELAQEAEHHRDNWMLKTRGETSFSDRIDTMKYKKDQLVGASARGD